MTVFPFAHTNPRTILINTFLSMTMANLITLVTGTFSFHPTLLPYFHSEEWSKLLRFL